MVIVFKKRSPGGAECFPSSGASPVLRPVSGRDPFVVYYDEAVDFLPRIRYKTIDPIN